MTNFDPGIMFLIGMISLLSLLPKVTAKVTKLSHIGPEKIQLSVKNFAECSHSVTILENCMQQDAFNNTPLR